ncbi:MAG: hypothetical protein PHD06_09225 [Bacteroidales bacterium]|jgi:hypothetical protein|nr:hypothetical protein [Bacteroidales bacterium]MDD4385343.1 hypothetical protein [Bacteroidales bacterium]MDY0198524.1 hypothetical protein [Tenuifilaceae bacterium]
MRALHFVFFMIISCLTVSQSRETVITVSSDLSFLLDSIECHLYKDIQQCNECMVALDKGEITSESEFRSYSFSLNMLLKNCEQPIQIGYTDDMKSKKRLKIKATSKFEDFWVYIKKHNKLPCNMIDKFIYTAHLNVDGIILQAEYIAIFKDEKLEIQNQRLDVLKK